MSQSQSTSEQVLGEMHSKMDKTRQEWEDEVSKLKWDFFNLKPHERITTNGNDVLGTVDPSGIFIDSDMQKKKFRVTFDVSQFSPSEINVRTQDNKLYVHAKHDEVNHGKNVSREFSRQIDIPRYVDPNTLKSVLGKDGILEVEAPVCPPSNNEGQGSRSHEDGSKVSPYNSLPPLSIPGGWSSGTPSPGMSSGSPSPGIRPGTVYTEKDGTRKLKMMIEVGSEFSPEEVMVKTVDRKLQISAKHEEKQDSRTTKKEYNKEFELPENIDASAVTASMTPDGKLVIEAPMTSFNQGSYQGQPGSTKQPELRVTFQ